MEVDNSALLHTDSAFTLLDLPVDFRYFPGIENPGVRNLGCRDAGGRVLRPGGNRTSLFYLKAIGTQHGNITGQMGDILKKAGKKPGTSLSAAFDLAPATIDGLKSGYISATLDQLLYLQGFIPVLQCVMTAKYKMPASTSTPAPAPLRRRRSTPWLR